MRIVYFGSAQFGIPSLEGLVGSRHELVHIFTQPARPKGRGKKPVPTDVAVWAGQKGIGFTETGNINKPDMIEQLKSYRADLLVVIAFGQKISQEVVEVFPAGAINVHSSVLPKYRGAAPINWAIINGETRTGVTVITLAERMDAGFMLGTAETNIDPDENAQSLHDRLSELAVALLLDTVEQIEAGTAQYKLQDESQVTLAPSFKKSDGYIDFNRTAGAIKDQVRGMYPWPGAQAFFLKSGSGKKERVTFASVDVVDNENGNAEKAGLLDDDLNIICAQGKLRPVRLKPAGKSEMEYRDFINGRHLKPGDRFISPVEE